MPRPSRRKLILYSAAAVPVLLLGAAWLARAPLGVWAVTDYLRRQGVPAELVIESLSAHGFVGSVTAGPAADPDLVIDHVEADYALFPDHRFAPRVNAVRLSGVKLKVAFDGKGFRFGSLQPLVDKALAAPSGGPAPSVQFSDAQVRLATPAGALLLTGQGQIDDARLKRLTMALLAPQISGAGARATNLKGTLTATGTDRIDAQLSLTADSGQSKGALAQAQALALRATVSLPYGRDAAHLLDGAVTLGSSLEAASMTGAGWTAKVAALRLDLSGALSGTLDKPRYAGRAVLAGASESAGQGRTVLTRPGFNLASAQVSAGLTGDGLIASAPVAGHAFAAAARAGSVAFSQVDLRGAGPAAISASGFTADLTGAAGARGGFSAGGAKALADGVAPPGVTPALNAALRTALAAWRLEAPVWRATIDNGPVTVRLTQPARAAFKDGALILTAAPASPLAAVTPAGAAGALGLTLKGAGLPDVELAVGRYRANSAGLNASAQLALKGDILPAEGLELTANLTLAPSRSGTAVTLDACAPLTLAALRAGADPLLTKARAQVCPDAAPLATVGSGRWSTAIRLREAVFSLPGAMAAVTGTEAQISLSGAGSGKPSGSIALTAARLTDAAAPVRFSPLVLSGRFVLADDRISGPLDVAVASRPGKLATLSVLHDLPASEGRAILDTTRLTFVAGGLQPGDVAPALKAFATKAAGPLDVSAQVGWGPRGIGGSARIAADGLDFDTTGGRITGLKGSVDFPAMTPVAVTAPDQHLTAVRYQSAVAATDIDLRFALDGEAFRIAGARATVAKGSVSLDPLELPLAPGKTSSSVLHADSVDLGEIVSGLNLADSVTIEARVQATLPFSLTPQGLRFSNGRIAAVGPGRLSVKRSALTGVATGAATAQSSAPGAPPPAPVPTNAVQDFAYQALENMAFEQLDATVDSRPMGRLGVVFHIKGKHDPAKPQDARIGMVDLARGTAFDKPIPLPAGTPVDLTLDTSLNFDDLMAAYGRLGRSDAVQAPKP